jgi:hypothetical protein
MFLALAHRGKGIKSVLEVGVLTRQILVAAMSDQSTDWLIHYLTDYENKVWFHEHKA